MNPAAGHHRFLNRTQRRNGQRHGLERCGQRLTALRAQLVYRRLPIHTGCRKHLGDHPLGH